MPDDPVAESPVFFDTNILLYLFDRSSEEKRHVAAKLFNEHQKNGRMRLSLQVVHEFAANLLSKKFGVPCATVAEVVGDLLALEVTEMRGDDTLTALQFVGELRVNFWDALILAAAKREGCGVLYSEDFQHGRVYGTVKVINPFESNS
ncbi:MAG: PIN domain-containing protein [Bryobacteraceae bacterium]